MVNPPDLTTSRPRTSPMTWIGLFVALFGMLLVRGAVDYMLPEVTVSSALLKEAGMGLVGLIILAIATSWPT
jgi:drug/metabolite transporter (DMT)-like permease